MWRSFSVHEKKDTEFLDAAIERIEFDQNLREKAEALMRGAASSESLIEENFKTPQDPHYHAEGPFVEDHVRLMLMILYAIVEEKFHLIDIEEFRRLKGYEGEIDEIEETIKENLALFEVFALCHDVGKWATISFESKEGSRGDAMGFNLKIDYEWDLFNISERAKIRERYLDLYQQFSRQHPNESKQEIQAQFFLAYGIGLHYPGHQRVIHTQVYRSLLERFGFAHRLPEKDIEMLEDIIANHLDPLHDFRRVNPSAVGKYMGFARGRGYDADDFIDILQAGVFLDAVCGSVRRSAHGLWHDHSPFTNFLKSEHDYEPERRAEKSAARQQEIRRNQNRVFKQVGLDGEGLMELLQMQPGPEFGRALRRVQTAVIGKGRMPQFSNHVNQQINFRAGAYYQAWFSKGE